MIPKIMKMNNFQVELSNISAKNITTAYKTGLDRIKIINCLGAYESVPAKMKHLTLANKM